MNMLLNKFLYRKKKPNVKSYINLNDLLKVMHKQQHCKNGTKYGRMAMLPSMMIPFTSTLKDSNWFSCSNLKPAKMTILQKGHEIIIHQPV